MLLAGSSNSQESFPGGGAGGGGGASMDGYGGQYAGYPPQPNQSQGMYYNGHTAVSLVAGHGYILPLIPMM